MDLDIRTEQPTDIDAIRDVNRAAFGQDAEAHIVDALRARGAVHLSLVAVLKGAVVGHLLFSPAAIDPYDGSALGPMAVAPTHQRHGIGSRLVTRGLAELDARGCPAVVVVGHPAFYPRFGFESAADHGLTCDWDLPPGVFMVRRLKALDVRDLRGRVVYQPEFAAAE